MEDISKKRIFKTVKKYLKNDPNIMFMVYQKKGLRGIEVITIHQVPLMNYPTIINSIEETINEMKNIYEKEKSHENE